MSETQVDANNNTDVNNNNSNNQGSSEPNSSENNTKILYPSGELLLSIMQKEYDYESARKTALETRAGILLSVAAVILTFIFSNVKIPKINSPIDDYSSLTLYISNFLMVIISIGAIIVSLSYLLRVIFIREYNRFDTKSLNEKNAVSQLDVVAMALIDKYNQIHLHNQKVNNEKTKLFHKGTIWLIVSLFASVILYGIALIL